MIREITVRHLLTISAPRVSGDDPFLNTTRGVRRECSPRERG